MTITINRAKARRERVQALAREDILEAALGAFAKHGYGATKIADIAAAAGYTAASLYTYFPGKREIFSAAAEHFVSGVEEAFGAIPEAPPADFETFAAEVEARIQSLCTYGDEHSDVLAFFMRLRWSGEPVLQELGTKELPCRGLLPESEGAEHGAFRLQNHFARVWKALGVERFGINPEIAAGLLGATIESVFVRKYIFLAGGTLADDAHAIALLLLYGLRGSR